SIIWGELGFFACPSPIPLAPSELKPSSATAIIRSIIIPDSIRHLCSSRLQKKILSQRIFDSNSTHLRFSRQAPPTPPPRTESEGQGRFPPPNFQRSQSQSNCHFERSETPAFRPPIATAAPAHTKP